MLNVVVLAYNYANKGLRPEYFPVNIRISFGAVFFGDTYEQVVRVG